jgi:uncharacterized membrane protein
VLQLLCVIAVIGDGLVAGVFFAVAVSVLPTLVGLPAGQYVQVHQSLGRGYHPAMPLIVNAATIAELVLTIRTQGGVQVLFAAALFASIAVQFVSHLCNVPINRLVHGMDPRALPVDWRDPRPLWRAWHLVRTVFAGVGLVIVSIAAVQLR